MQLPFGLTASILKLWQERPKLLKRLLSFDVMQGVSTPRRITHFKIVHY
jgi:hypothetical protein